MVMASVSMPGKAKQIKTESAKHPPGLAATGKGKLI